MNKKIKTKWLKALRSKKYKQGQTVLQTLDGKFCCLGVLADVCNTKWDGEYHPKDFSCTSGIKCSAANKKKDYAVLNTNFLKVVGLTSRVQDKLTYMNDHGYSFSNIAKWIEKNL